MIGAFVFGGGAFAFAHHEQVIELRVELEGDG